MPWFDLGDSKMRGRGLFLKNVVSGLGLVSTLKQYSLKKKERPRPRPRVLLTALWLPRASKNWGTHAGSALSLSELLE